MADLQTLSGESTIAATMPDQSSISSRHVSAAIRSVIWPILKRRNFDEFTSRTAWMHTPEAIRVVTFQSFGTYLASSVGCTTYSFALNLGVFYPCVPDAPWAGRWPEGYFDPRPRPSEAACHARMRPTKNIEQAELAHRDIWYVRADGSNLDVAIDDARRVLETIGLPWLDRFSDRRHALREILVPHERRTEFHIPDIGCPAAARVGSALAFSLQDISAAKELWKAVEQNPRYAKLPVYLAEARSMLELLGAPKWQESKPPVTDAR
jgi:hypothetical protein